MISYLFLIISCKKKNKKTIKNKKHFLFFTLEHKFCTKKEAKSGIKKLICRPHNKSVYYPPCQVKAWNKNR
jgi:hypothetical protein